MKDLTSHIIKEGKGNIMFSAPHNVEQVRNGKIKCAEPETGELIESLYEILEVPYIKKVNNLNDDANYDKKSLYRDDLATFIKDSGIKLLFDLHQLSPDRDVMVDIGTGGWKNVNDMNIINSVLKAFTEKKLGTIQIDNPFGATYEFTVSASISKACNIPCVQIEINSRLLYNEFDEYNYNGVLDALVNMYKMCGELL